MARLIFPGQSCPHWLERIEFDGVNANDKMRARRLLLVSIYTEDGDDGFWVRPVFPAAGVGLFRVRNKGVTATRIFGQSPAGGTLPVRLDSSPLIDWPWLALVAAACMLVLCGRA